MQVEAITHCLLLESIDGLELSSNIVINRLEALESIL
jgi:hypothetical protein